MSGESCPELEAHEAFSSAVVICGIHFVTSRQRNFQSSFVFLSTGEYLLSLHTIQIRVSHLITKSTLRGFPREALSPAHLSHASSHLDHDNSSASRNQWRTGRHRRGDWSRGTSRIPSVPRNSCVRSACSNVRWLGLQHPRSALEAPTHLHSLLLLAQVPRSRRPALAAPPDRRRRINAVARLVRARAGDLLLGPGHDASDCRRAGESAQDRP